MEPKYSLDDKLYLAETTRTCERVPCPVCNTNKVVTVILGCGSHVEVECDYCGKGLEGPVGYVNGPWNWTPQVDGPRIVTGIRIEDEGDGAKIDYYFRVSGGMSYVRSEEQVETTSQAAQATAEKLARERNKDEETRKEESKEKRAKSYAWHVGYHLKGAKEAARQYRYHKRKVRFMQSKVRKAKNEPVAES